MKAQSSDEIFDVVDAADCVIGQEKRSVVHERHLLHRAVHILVFNSKGDLFLQKRSPWKDTQPNRWVTSCSGHVDAGESYDQASARELKEELGLQKIPFLQFLFRLEPQESTGWEFVSVYQTLSDGPFDLPPEEISEGKFVSPEKIAQWVESSPEDFTSSFLEVWKKFNKN